MNELALWQEVKFESYGPVWGDMYREWLKLYMNRTTCKENNEKCVS